MWGRAECPALWLAANSHRMQSKGLPKARLGVSCVDHGSGGGAAIMIGFHIMDAPVRPWKRRYINCKGFDQVESPRRWFGHDEKVRGVAGVKRRNERCAGEIEHTQTAEALWIH